jgi:hypothetical protein
MSKVILSFVAFSLLLAGTASAQNNIPAKPRTVKASVLSAKVSADGKSLVTKTGELWSVTNIDTLTGHEGQTVTVKYKRQGDPAEHTMYVISLKLLPPQNQYAANLYDSAFRR